MNIHGGDVWQVAEEMGGDASELLDFSANINPRGLPMQALLRLTRNAGNPQLLGFYPDPSARHLRRALSAHTGVAADQFVIGPGAEALLAPILRALHVRRVLVPVPAFSEYRRASEQQNVHYVPFPLHHADSFQLPVAHLCRRIEEEPFDAVLLSNPHNPSGAMLDARDVRLVLDAANASGATLLLDEAFIDYAPGQSLIAETIERPGLVVLRSLTKFYGCPALRVGYAAAHPDMARRISSLLPTWPVMQMALDALTDALDDRQYVESSLRENAANRDTLRAALLALGLIVFPSAANYLLVELLPRMPSSTELRTRLIKHHRILIRNCDSYEGLTHGHFIRVAVRSAEENERLVNALSEELRAT